MKYLQLLILLLLFNSCRSTKDSPSFGLDEPDPKGDKKDCAEFLQRINDLPADVSMGLFEKDGDIYWGITDDRYLAKIFKDNSDGVGVDIVSKSQFPCGAKNILPATGIYKGELQKPVFLKDVKNHIWTDNQGMAGFKVGQLPEKFKGTEYELNMLMIHKGKVCRYDAFYDVPRSRWELLEMPLYYDSARTTDKSGVAAPLVLEKKIRFVIPFKKNKYDYSDEDIRPLYDSLNISGYTIKSIKIEAYASVEGPTDNNIRLQNNRAEAIAKALEKVQKKEAVKSIKAEENWVEFYRDIDTSSYKELGALEKSEIKKRLEELTLNAKLEPILSAHRKAIVELYLEKKGTMTDLSVDALKEAFNSAVSKNDTTKAVELQHLIFNKVLKNEADEHVVDSLHIPEEKSFTGLLNNRIAFRLKEDLSSIKKAIEELNKLKALSPSKSYLDYNLAVLKVKAWALYDSTIDAASLRKDINGLLKKGIGVGLIKTVTLNYHIILSEVQIANRDYDAKNQTLKYIFDNYKAIALTDRDLLQVAMYFSSYSRLDWAEKVLVNRARSLDASEDLLFYYLNLTIIEPKNLKKSAYRSVVSNAASKNPKRYCRMFDPYGKGGINFQLLADDYLKKTYCEVCK